MTPAAGPAAVPRLLELRARMFKGIRAFFDARGFTEVATPAIVPANAPEANIDAFPVGRGQFRTSPELHMKRLLAHGAGPIYQIAPCARREERSPLHREEFLLLEWYRPNAGERDILHDAQGLFAELAGLFRDDRAPGAPLLDARPESWKILTVREAFLAAAGWDPVADWDADRFDLDWVEKVEPALCAPHPVVLTGFPAPVAALAQLDPADPRVACRWELYWNGIELMNTFRELNDPAEQRRRFLEENRLRAARGEEPYPLDGDFLRDLALMPPAAGTALGVERLLMLLLGTDSIGGVRPLDPGD